MKLALEILDNDGVTIEKKVLRSVCGKEVDVIFGILAETQYLTKYRSSFSHKLKTH